MKKFATYSLILATTTLFLSACKSEDKQGQMPPTPVQVIEAKAVKLPIYREFVGSIFGYKDIPIRARVEGFLETIDFDEGSMVKQGQLLYTIDSQPFQADVAAAQSGVAEAETRLVNAENELARYKPLAETKAVSQSDVDAAQATRDAAEANLHAMEAKLEMSQINLSYATMYSPINGIIGRTQARVGEYVGREPNPVILNTVSRLDTVRVQFFLTESQYLIIAKEYRRRNDIADDHRPEQNENTAITLKLSDGSTYEHKGVVDFVDRNISESTGSILVQASFPNPDFILRPGLYAKVILMYDYDPDAVLVPQRCVVETQGQFSVMVVTDSNTVESRNIQIGETIGSNWQVKGGLKDGEKIVFEGLQRVRSGAHVVPELVPFEVEIQ